MFWIDKKNNCIKTYVDLITDLNSIKDISTFIYTNDSYQVQLKIIYGLAAGIEMILLDGDFSELEIENLGIDIEGISYKSEVPYLNLSSFSDLISRINEGKKTWALSIYTSGTTGRPKKVVHSLDSLTRYVKVSSNNSNNIWSYAYNPTHIAGVQLLLQAFFNRNPMVYMFGCKPSEVPNLLIENKVTNISATPTFYRMLIPYLFDSIPSVHTVTVGGEKFDSSLKDKIMIAFPNCRIKNIYASTEAGSLFASNGDNFIIPKHLRSKIMISKENELLIHQDLLGQYFDGVVSDCWYNTGDLIELIGDFEFHFVSRKSEAINIGGYKVNPHEVEGILRTIPGILDVLIYARANKITGNILAADIIKNKILDDDELKRNIFEVLKNNLQEWKIPSIIKFVDHFDTTRSGKKVRL
ncbi:MAG: AMP-binding enzyme C-terminal protein [Bacilli bacterium]|nr:AMP-binding enzyme C-terminal protein [Bacilli bacterium]